MKKYSVLGVLNLLAFGFVFSQTGIRLKHAEILVAEGKYEKAIEKYLKLYRKDSVDFETNLGLGILFEEFIYDEDAALPYLERAYRLLKKDTFPELTFALGKCRLHNADYTGALKLFEQCHKFTLVDDDGQALKRQIEFYIDHCKTGSDYLAKMKSRKYRILNAGVGVNTHYSEYSPVADSAGRNLLFTSRRPENAGGQIDKYDHRYFEDIYFAEGENGVFKDARNSQLQTRIAGFENSPDHDAVVSMSHDGKKLFFYKDNGLHVCEWTGSAWGTPVRLPESINAPHSYEPHASISPDGKTLVFTSNKVEGTGGLDLYMSKLEPNGGWSEPVSLGAEINTAENEDSPFFSADGKSLYFASRGLTGYGGYDIFVSSFDGSTFGKPENLQPPINSPNEDIYFSVSGDGTQGYFASSRKGGYGDMDIYRFFEMDKPSWQSCAQSQAQDRVKFKVPDTIYVNELSLFDGSISKFNSEYPYHYYWKVNDSVMPVDSSKYFHYFRRNGTYTVSMHCITYSDSAASRLNYCYTKNVTVVNRPVADIVKVEPPIAKDETNISLTGMADVSKIDTTLLEVFKIELDDIYFDLGKSNLRKDAMKTINTNIDKLKVNKRIMIKIAAHTDSRASKEYNMKLSQKRSQAVIAYLGKKGIGKNRILAVLNMGENSDLEESCKGDKDCLEKIYQMNRRVEFKVIGVLPAPVKKSAKKPASSTKSGSKAGTSKKPAAKK